MRVTWEWMEATDGLTLEVQTQPLRLCPWPSPAHTQCSSEPAGLKACSCLQLPIQLLGMQKQFSDRAQPKATGTYTLCHSASATLGRPYTSLVGEESSPVSFREDGVQSKEAVCSSDPFGKPLTVCRKGPRCTGLRMPTQKQPPLSLLALKQPFGFPHTGRHHLLGHLTEFGHEAKERLLQGDGILNQSSYPTVIQLGLQQRPSVAQPGAATA